MNKVRLLAFAVTSLCVVAIGSYYLFGGPLRISLFFPAPTFYEPNNLRLPTLKPVAPGPKLGLMPSPLPSPSKVPHPSMRTPSRTDALVHMSPAPYMPMPVSAVTPPSGPTYAPVTPPPYTPSKPVVTLPQPGESPTPSPTP
jgi:hypothetical protein